MENLLQSFFVFPLSLFVQFRRDSLLAQNSNTQNWQGKVCLFSLLSGSSWKCVMILFMLLMLCHTILRVAAKAYWNQQSTSRMLDWSTSCTFLSSGVRSGYLPVGKTSEGTYVLLWSILIRVISTCSVAPEAEDFFGIRWSWVYDTPKQGPFEAALSAQPIPVQPMAKL